MPKLKKLKKKLNKKKLVSKKQITKKQKKTVKTPEVVQKNRVKAVKTQKLKRQTKPKTAVVNDAAKVISWVDEVPKSNVYFTASTEKAIIDYVKADCARVKDTIYNESIRHPFEKIAENVYNKFKFSYSDVSPIEVQKQAVSHMVANIEKYDSSKGKAFSYFSIVAKNWFILDNNNNYKRFTRHVEICEQPGDSGEFLVEPKHHSRDTELREFVRLMVDFWDKNVGKYFTKDRDLKIANAVIDIFRNSDRMEMFNKKGIYIIIREMSRQPTQHVTKIINKMKQMQKNIWLEYCNTGLVTGEKIYHCCHR